jgi:hypothetical protein
MRATTVPIVPPAAPSAPSTSPRLRPRPPGRPGSAGPIVGAVRLTHFRQLMDDEFGAVRAGSISRDHVFGALGGRTVEQALEDGDEPRDVWRVVCAEFEVPAERR